MATKLYFPSTGTAAVSPSFSASWDNTDDATRLPLAIGSKTSTAMTTTAYFDTDNGDTDHLIHQWVSAPINGVTLTAQTLQSVFRCQEGASQDNQLLTIGVRVVSGDGGTVRGTVIDVTRDDIEITSASLSSSAWSASTTQVIAQGGDRIVVEVGTGGNPSGPNDHDTDLRIGDNAASDLPFTDSSLDDYNPWMEFTETITEQTGTSIPILAYHYYHHTLDVG